MGTENYEYQLIKAEYELYFAKYFSSNPLQWHTEPKYYSYNPIQRRSE